MSYRCSCFNRDCKIRQLFHMLLLRECFTPLQHSKEQRKWSKIRDERVPKGDMPSSCATASFWMLSTMTHTFQQLF